MSDLDAVLHWIPQKRNVVALSVFEMCRGLMGVGASRISLCNPFLHLIYRIVIVCKTGAGGDLADVMWSYHAAPGDALYIVSLISSSKLFICIWKAFLFFFSRTQLLFMSECCLTSNEQFIYDGKTFLPSYYVMAQSSSSFCRRDGFRAISEFEHNDPWHWIQVGIDLEYCNPTFSKQDVVSCKNWCFCYLYTQSLFFISFLCFG